MSSATAPPPRLIKVSAAGLLLPVESKNWAGVYIPAAQITVPRTLVLPGVGTWQWAQERCAALRLCGWTNWQAVSRLQFCNHLVDGERYGPCVDTDFFTVEDRYTWAWTRDEGAPRGCAFGVSVYDGFVARNHQSNHDSALPCRPGQVPWTSEGMAPTEIPAAAPSLTDADVPY